MTKDTMNSAIEKYDFCHIGNMSVELKLVALR